MMPPTAGDVAGVPGAVPPDDPSERHKRGTRQLLIARGCFFVCSYVGSAVLARKLGADAFGIYGVILSLLLWVEMVANAGLPAATAKLLAGRDDPVGVERAAHSLLLIVSIFVLAVTWLASPWVARVMGIPDGSFLLRLAFLDLPLAGIYASYEGVLNGHRRFGIIAAMHITLGLTRLAGILTLAALGLSLERVFIAYVLATAAVCAVLLARYPPAGLCADSRALARTLAIAGPLAGYFISGQVLVNLDLWMLKSLWRGNGEIVGHYVASANLARTLMLVPAVQAGVLFASVAWAVASHDPMRVREHVREASRFAIVVVAAAWVILGLNGSAVLSLLFSAEYAPGSRFLWLQLAGFSLFALVDAFANSLQAAGGSWRVAAALVPTIMLSWLSNLLLIPRLGPIGAAMSMPLAMGTSAVIMAVLVYRRFGSPIPLSTVLRVIVAAIVVAIVSYAVEFGDRLVVAKLVLLGVTYLFVLYVQGEITPQGMGLGQAARRRSL